MGIRTAHAKTRRALFTALGAVSTAVDLAARAFARLTWHDADRIGVTGDSRYLEPGFLIRLTSPPAARETSY